MKINHYIDKGFKLVGFMFKPTHPTNKHGVNVRFVDEASMIGKKGVYILASEDKVMKIGETEQMYTRMKLYENHTGVTNTFVRDSIEIGDELSIYFIECPSFEVEFAGVKVETGVSYKVLEKRLLDQYKQAVGNYPPLNKGRQ